MAIRIMPNKCLSCGSLSGCIENGCKCSEIKKSYGRVQNREDEIAGLIVDILKGKVDRSKIRADNRRKWLIAEEQRGL